MKITKKPDYILEVLTESQIDGLRLLARTCDCCEAGVPVSLDMAGGRVFGVHIVQTPLGGPYRVRCRRNPQGAITIEPTSLAPPSSGEGM